MTNENNYDNEIEPDNMISESHLSDHEDDNSELNSESDNDSLSESKDGGEEVFKNYFFIVILS